MQPADFKMAWEADGDTLHSYSEAALSTFVVPEQAHQFLVSAGLPTEAAPCLSFGTATVDWNRPELNRSYFPLGSDGAGNPIVLDTLGVVSVLDYERPSQLQYMNKDVATLAETLWLYRSLIREAEIEAGLDDFDGAVPAHLRKKLIAFLQERDLLALDFDTAWASELLIDR